MVEPPAEHFCVCLQVDPSGMVYSKSMSVSNSTVICISLMEKFLSLPQEILGEVALSAVHFPSMTFCYIQSEYNYHQFHGRTYLKAVAGLDATSAIAAREGIFAVKAREVKASKIAEAAIRKAAPVEATFLLVGTDIVVVGGVVEGLRGAPVEVGRSRLQQEKRGQKARTQCDHSE
jgi:hypothetical protein